MLILEDGEKIIRTLQIPAPTRDVDTLYGIAAQYLETLQTTAPVTGFHLEVLPSRPAGHQFDLFQGGLKDPNRFFQTLARLAALVGNEKVGIPQRIDTHRPDSLQMVMPELAVPEKRQKSGRPKTGPGLRRYRPGIAARVELNDGKPVLMQSSLISGRILEARGPWKLSGNWWDRTRWETKEWDIALDNGGLYRIAQKTTNFNEDQRKTTDFKIERSGSLALQDQWEVVGVYDSDAPNAKFGCERTTSNFTLAARSVFYEEALRRNIWPLRRRTCIAGPGALRSRRGIWRTAILRGGTRMWNTTDRWQRIDDGRRLGFAGARTIEKWVPKVMPFTFTSQASFTQE